MNWLKRLWNWFITPNEDACCAEPHEVTPVEVEEEARTSGSIFGTICRAAGVKQRDIDSSNAVALFEQWYGGPVNEESIKQSLQDFKVLHPGVNAKLAGRI
jgi:hypothetical protein